MFNSDNTRVMVFKPNEKYLSNETFSHISESKCFLETTWNHRVANSMAYLLYLEARRQVPLRSFPSQIFLSLIFANSGQHHMKSKPETHLAIKQVLDLQVLMHSLLDGV